MQGKHLKVCLNISFFPLQNIINVAIALIESLTATWTLTGNPEITTIGFRSTWSNSIMCTGFTWEVRIQRELPTYCCQTSVAKKSIIVDCSHIHSSDIQSYYYLRAVVTNTPMPSDYHHYDYCNSGHVYWRSDHSRCHVVRWLNQYGTICMDLGGGATDRVCCSCVPRAWRVTCDTCEMGLPSCKFTEHVVHLLGRRLQDPEPLCRHPEI